jgi:hypothetical protein
VSLRIITEGTHSDTRNSGFQTHNTFLYAKEMSVIFCSELKVSEASMRRLRWIGGREACATWRAEVRVRRRCVDR